MWVVLPYGHTGDLRFKNSEKAERLTSGERNSPIDSGPRLVIGPTNIR